MAVFRHSLLAMVLIVCLPALTQAYPTYYSQGLGHDGCVLPTRGYAAHKAPQQDSSITFTLLDPTTSVPVAAFAPGKTYLLKVSTPTSVLGFVLTSGGSFDRPDFECGGQRKTFVRMATSNVVEWTAPVSGGEVVFRANYAKGGSTPYLQNTATFLAQ